MFGAIPGGGGGILTCEVELKRAPASKAPCYIYFKIQFLKKCLNPEQKVYICNFLTGATTVTGATGAC